MARTQDLRRRWSELTVETRAVVAVSLLFVVYRAVLATQSGFGFHQGWNEGHYALLGRGFLAHPIVPRYGEMYVYNVPPLFPYLVAGSFALFGQSELAARLPSILAAGATIPAVYALGREVYDRRRVATAGALLFAALPYVQLYGGRTQTDVLMVFGITASLACLVRGYERDRWRPWMYGGAVLYVVAVSSKQPALLLAGVVFLWLVANRRFDRDTVWRTAHLVGATVVALVPLLAWYLYNYSVAPGPFVSDWRHELFGRTAAFANVKLLLLVAVGIGITPPVVLLVGGEIAARGRDLLQRLRNGSPDSFDVTPLGLWLVVFGAFVLYRTPSGHQYYAVVLLPAVALVAARGYVRFVPLLDGRLRTVVAAVVVLGLLGGTVVMLDLSGEFSVGEGGGEHVAADTVADLSSSVPDDALVLAPNEYQPPVSWYARGSIGLDSVRGYRVSNLTADSLERIADSTERPVYLLYPDPAWSPRPNVSFERLFASDGYRLTTTRYLPSALRPGGKFVHYFGERRLVAYRICPDSRC